MIEPESAASNGLEILDLSRFELGNRSFLRA
jgi:hypothetical protein